MEPYEIIAAPFDVWVAALGEAFPLIDAAPGGGWTKVGTNGNKNISEDGVTVSHEESIEEFRMLGATGPIKASRTSEGLSVSFMLHDITLEQYRAALGFNALTTVAAASGTAGYKWAGLAKALDVAERAVLIRGPSPYGDSWNLQYQVPRAYVRSEAEVVYQKGEPAGLEITFVALVDLDAATEAEQFGRIVAQHAAPLP